MRLPFRLCKTRRARLLLSATLLTVVVGCFAAVPLRVRYQLWQARRALSNRNAEQATEFLKSAERLEPDNGEIHFLLARAYRRQGRFDLVRHEIERAWQCGHPTEILQREQWLALAQAGQMKEAEPHLQELLMNAGEDGPEICEAYVNGYLRLYRISPALRLLDAWQADFPDDPRPHFCRGVVWRHLRQRAKAAEEFNRALRIDPDDVESRLRLATVLAELHEFESAATEYAACLQQRPTDVGVLYGLAVCLRAEGKTAEAKTAFQRVLELAPDHFGAQFKMGQLALSENKVPEALDWLNAAVKQEPFNQAARYSLASALQANGQADAARPHFQYAAEADIKLEKVQLLMEVVAKQPDLVEPRHQVGAILLQYGSPAEAVGWLHSALQIDAGHEATHKLLADYYARQGDRTRADFHRRHAGH